MEILVLASGSETRQRLLTNAGIQFLVERPNVNEGKIKHEHKANQLSSMETAKALARAKADAIKKKHKDTYILAADQILTCEGEWFDKPVGQNGVREHLAKLSGKRHDLVNATIVIRNNTIVWTHENVVSIELRTLSTEFINSYIKLTGNTAFQSVGGYNIEGLGVQLVRVIDGDFFSTLGLPLIPLLEFFRDCGLASS